MKHSYNKVSIKLRDGIKIYQLRHWCKANLGPGKLEGWTFLWYGKEKWVENDGIVSFYFKEPEHAVLFRLTWE